jgi:hypothetical protein
MPPAKLGESWELEKKVFYEARRAEVTSAIFSVEKNAATSQSGSQ